MFLETVCIGLLVQDLSFQDEAGQNQPSRSQHDVAMELIQHEIQAALNIFRFPQTMVILHA